MGSYINLNELNWCDLAGNYEGVVFTCQIFEGSLWACLVCGRQGIRLPDWDEASAHNLRTLEVDTCCGHHEGLAALHWCGEREGKTPRLFVEVWKEQGGTLCRQICFQSHWSLKGFEEARNFFDGLLKIAKNGDGIDGYLAGADCQPELPF